MEWHQFMREERARKLAVIDSLSSGSMTIAVSSQDVSANIAEEFRHHVAQIETILRAAGQPLDS